MKVKLTNQYCGPKGSFTPGSIIEVEYGEGQQLIIGGYAEAVADAKPSHAAKPAAAAPVVEAPVVEAAPEPAVEVPAVPKPKAKAKAKAKKAKAKRRGGAK